MTRSITAATRANVHNCVAYPCPSAPTQLLLDPRLLFGGPARRPTGPTRVDQRRLALLGPRRYQRDTLCRLTFNRRATSACGTPFVNNFAAARRRRASASKSRR